MGVRFCGDLLPRDQGLATTKRNVLPAQSSEEWRVILPGQPLKDLWLPLLRQVLAVQRGLGIAMWCTS